MDDGRGSASMKRILITGGAGFLGSHLCDRLIGEGADVVCLDNFFSGSKDNIRHLFNDPYFELIRHDVIHPLFVEVDRIYHLACPASPDPLPVQLHQDHQDQRHGHDQHARPGQTDPGPDPPGLDLRGLRRPQGPSPAGKLLGQRQPDRHPELLRRGEAGRRDA